MELVLGYPFTLRDSAHAWADCRQLGRVELYFAGFVLTQARSASEGKAVRRWRFGLVSELPALSIKVRGVSVSVINSVSIKIRLR